MAFGVLLECQEVLANIQMHNEASIEKLASVDDEIKKTKVNAMRVQAS